MDVIDAGDRYVITGNDIYTYFGYLQTISQMKSPDNQKAMTDNLMQGLSDASKKSGPMVATLDEVNVNGQKPPEKWWNKKLCGMNTGPSDPPSQKDIDKFNAKYAAILLVADFVDPELVVSQIEERAAAREEIHHFATNKSKTYSKLLKKLIERYGLDLDEAWNKALLKHSGRHCNEYHEFVLKAMQKAAQEAGGNTAKFLELFDKYVAIPVSKAPEMMYKNYWK